MTEEVSGARFATLENEVKHITADVTDIKDSTKITELAIQSIDLSVALMAKSIEQNGKLEPRIEKLELRQNNVDIKMGAYVGALAALSFIVVKFEKVVAFFG